jgi:hypothetical protein
MTTRGGQATAPTTSNNSPSPSPVLQAPSEGWRLAKEWFPLLPKTKLLLYGDSGTGKSTFVATYAEVAAELGMPILVCAFDPPSKMSPYKDHPLVYGVEPVEGETADYYKQFGIHAEDVLDQKGNLVFRIEYYVEPDPDNPRAADAVEARLAGFYQEATNWYAAVFDSMTFYQNAAIRRVQKRMGFTIDKMFGKGEGIDMRQWYAVAKMDLDRMIRQQMLWWPTNGIAIHHTSEDKSEFADTTVRGILTIGKLLAELPPGFDEMYKVCLNQREKIRDEQGKETADYKRYLQTRHDTVWAATSVTAKAPNPCEPNYRALWKNWQEMKERKGVTPTG